LSNIQLLTLSFVENLAMKYILALATLVAIPLLINNNIAKADGSADYILNCRSEDFQRCWSEYQANDKTEWENIKNAYNNILESLTRKDMNQFTASFAPDFQLRHTNGVVINLEQLRQGNQELLKRASQFQASANIISRDIGREYAKVMSIEHFNATLPNSQNSLVPMYKEIAVEQTWRRTNNGWKLVYINVLSNSNYAERQSPSVPSVGSGTGFGGFGGGAANMIREAGNGLSTVR
jgi:SnoaL-like domain